MSNPIEAIRDYIPGVYDVILLDIQMPKMDGFDVYRELRRIDKDARICFLTAVDGYQDKFKRLFHEVRNQEDSDAIIGDPLSAAFWPFEESPPVDR
jgi:CheY-like chemotaxis protein